MPRPEDDREGFVSTDLRFPLPSTASMYCSFSSSVNDIRSHTLPVPSWGKPDVTSSSVDVAESRYRSRSRTGSTSSAGRCAGSGISGASGSWERHG
ncbi:hypothetical protein FKM82_031320 [Ascaphus truei]